MAGERVSSPSLPFERRLQALDYDGVAAHFRSIASFEPPNRADYGKILRDLDGALRRAPDSAPLLALKGKALFNLSRFEPARRTLERSLALDGDDARTRAWLGETHLLLNRPDAALAELNRALELDPKCAWALFHRSAARVIRGETDAAAAELGRLMRSASDENARIAARALLGLLDANAGRFGAALSHIDAVRTRNPGRSWPCVLRAAVLRLRDDRRRAPSSKPQEAAHGRARARNSDSRVHERLGDKLARSGRPAEAERAYRKACASRPDSLQPFFRLARLLLFRGDRRGMEKILRDAQRRTREFEGDDVQVWVERFQLALCRRDNEEAVRAGELVLDRTRRLDHLEGLSVPILPGFEGAAAPEAFKRYVKRALAKAALFASRRPRTAWGDYIHHQWREAEGGPKGRVPKIRLFPDARYGWMRKSSGVALLYEGRFGEALRHLKAARDFSQPADWRCACHIGEALAFQGKWPEALRAFRAAESIAGGARGEATAWKAEALLWAGRYEQSLRALESIPKEANSPYAACWKGAAFSKLGRFQEALASLDAAIARLPNDGEARAWRAETLLRLGRARDAVREADAAAKRGLGSDFIDALRALARARVAGTKAADKERIAELEEFLRLSRGIRRADVLHAFRRGAGDGAEREFPMMSPASGRRA